jgi:hypothetical protein
MEKVESVLQSHGEYIDILVGVTLTGIFVYILFFHILLLGAIITITIPLTIYIPLRQKKYTHILPIIVGWIIGIYGYFASDNQLVISLILGIVVYMALMLYRRTDVRTEPNETR